MTERHSEAPKNFVGMPAALYLQEFGSHVWAAFGQPPYLVGSALLTKQWRDVDVRLILDDEEYVRLGLGAPNRSGSQNAKWVSLCMAYSALATKMTGLPVDFQIQAMSRANQIWGGEKRGEHPRFALGITPLRTMRSETDEKNDA